MGRAASANSYLGSAVLAVGTLKALQPSETRDRLLTDVASGAVRLAVAIESDFVPDAEGADRILVLTDDGVADTAPTVTATPVLDETRRLATVATDGSSELLLFDGDPRPRRADCVIARRSPSPATAWAYRRRCCPQPSATRRCASSSAGPSARFRPSSTRAPTCSSPISVSRQLVGAAVQAIAEDQPDADVAAAMAKSHACASAVDIAGKAMQLHGGIGYTWESGIHVYLKRAALNRSLFGSPAAHRKHLAQRYL